MLMSLLLLLLSCDQLAGTGEPDEVEHPSSTEIGRPVGASVPDDTRECVTIHLHGSPLQLANLLTPTLEERMIGGANIAWARLSSVTHSLSDEEDTLGVMDIEFDVVEHLRPLTPEHEDIRESFQFQITVGYECVYLEDKDRDMGAILEAARQIEMIFGDRELIVFPAQTEFSARAEFSVSSPEPTIHFNPRYFYTYWTWNNGSNWLLEAKGIQGVQSEEDNPVFIDPPNVTISLEEIRERLDAVMEIEEELGEECAWAISNHEWYIRSGEEFHYNRLRPLFVRLVEEETGSSDCVP